MRRPIGHTASFGRTQPDTASLADPNGYKEDQNGIRLGRPVRVGLIQDITKFKDFEDVSSRHEKREMNSEAHDLARASSSFDSGRHIWLLNLPDFIRIERFVEIE